MTPPNCRGVWETGTHVTEKEGRPAPVAGSLSSAAEAPPSPHVQLPASSVAFVGIVWSPSHPGYPPRQVSCPCTGMGPRTPRTPLQSGPPGTPVQWLCPQRCLALRGGPHLIRHSGSGQGGGGATPGQGTGRGRREGGRARRRVKR